MNDDIETVRGLLVLTNVNSELMLEGLAALDRLAARLQEAERERDEARAKAKSEYGRGWNNAVIAARGRAARDERRYG